MSKEPLMQRVVWADAYNEDQSAWVHIDKIDVEPAIIVSVGFVIKEGPKGLILAMDYDSDEHNCHAWSYIPKACIVSRTALAPSPQSPLAGQGAAPYGLPAVPSEIAASPALPLSISHPVPEKAYGETPTALQDLGYKPYLGVRPAEPVTIVPPREVQPGAVVWTW
jgi:hypothetical protein